VDLLQIACKQRASSGCASGLDHPVNAGFHFALYKSPRVCLLDAFPHGGAEASVPFQQAQGGFLY